MMWWMGNAGFFSIDGTATVYHNTPSIYLYVDVASDSYPERRIFDEFYEALRRCHDALAGLLRPWLATLRRTVRIDDARRQSLGPSLFIRRPAPRGKRHSPGHTNFHKVKA